MSRWRTAGAWTLTLLLFAVLAGNAHAQVWTVEVQAGRFHSAGAPVDTVSSTLSLSLRRGDVNSAVILSAGVPVTAHDPLWGFGGFARRVAVRFGGFSAGADIGAHGFLHVAPGAAGAGGGSGQRPPGLLGIFGQPDESPAGDDGFSVYGLGAEVMPLIGYRRARVAIEARAGAAHDHTMFGGGNGFGRTLFTSDVRLSVIPTSLLALEVDARRLAAEEATYGFAGASVALRHSRGSAWASTGRWLAPDTAGVAWTLGADLRLTERATLGVAGRHEPFDPIFLAGPRTSWSAGLGFRLSAPRRLAPPVPAAYQDGRATIVLPDARNGSAPRIAGDFNSWKPEPMAFDGRQWSYTVAVEPGIYHYAFVTADGEWFVPASVPGRKDDGMGGHVAVLIVE